MPNCTEESEHAVILQLQDNAIPCCAEVLDYEGLTGEHSHAGSVIHWFLGLVNGNMYSICSPITNTRKECVEKIVDADAVWVYCLIENK